MKKVFISSTDFDLKDLRAELAVALKEWGYQPLWNESPEFPKKHGMHSHDVCLDAVRNSDIYLLIIDKRYGGTYAGNNFHKENISITWYETKIAVSEKKPICAFVRDPVWNERPTYKKNLSASIPITPFHVDDPRVFDFIDYVVNLRKDNWIDQFKDSVELKTFLKNRLDVINIKPRLQPSLHFQPPPAPNFVGRGKELNGIREWYVDTNTRIGSLIAWGGEGKSTIARRFYDLLDESGIAPGGIFWWGFYNDPSVDGFMNALLEYLSGGTADPKEFTEVGRKVHKLLSLMQEGEFLLVLDGVEVIQTDIRDETFGQMNDPEMALLLKGIADSGGNGLCLVTTRYPLKDIENYLGGKYKAIEVTGIEKEAALKFLKDKGVIGEEDELGRFIDNIKGHAFTLHSIAKYIKRVCESRVDCVMDIEYVFEEEKRQKEINEKVFKRYMAAMSDAEKALLKLVSLFRTEVGKKEFESFFRKPINGTNMNKALLGMDRHGFIELLEGLKDWRLLSHDEKKNAYTTHPLTKGYFESVLDEKEKRLCHKALYEYYIGHELSEKPSYDELRPLNEGVHHALEAGMTREACRHAVHLGNRLEGLVLYREKAARLQAVADRIDEAVIKEAVVEKDEYVPMLLNNLGSAWQDLGDNKKAIEYIEKALEIDLKVFGDAHPSTAIDYNNLGMAWKALGDNKKAIDYYEKALKIDLKVFGDSHPKVAIRYNNLGAAWKALGEHKNAIEYIEKALEIDLKVFGDSHPSTAIDYNNLGATWQALGDNKKAIEYLEKALKIFETVFGKEHQNVATSLNNLGGAWQDLGDNKKAIEYYEKALKIDLKVFGDAHPSTAIDYNNLGSAWKALGENKKAIDYYEKALEILNKVFGPGHPDSEMVKKNLKSLKGG